MDERQPQSDDQHRPVVDGAIDGQSPAEFLDRCTVCGTTAPKDELGLCPTPTCRTVRKGAKLHSKYGPVNTGMRKKLHARFVREYQPVSAIDEARCLDLADIVERI